MEFQFNLPLSNSDLLNSSGDSYYVKHLYNQGEISGKLKLCKQMLFQNDPFYIFDHFDTYYAVIEQKGTDFAVMTNLMRAFDLLYVTVDKMGNVLAPFLAVSEPPNPQDRIGHLNLTKMCLYLLINVVRKIDANILSLQQQQQTNQQRKRGRQLEGLEQFSDWETKRSKFLVQLYNIMQFPLEKLWSPPLAEESFVNLLCDVCYRILELLHMRPDNRMVVNTIFQIIGTAIKRYQHAINFPVKILQIIRNAEHAGNSAAYGINLLHEEYSISSIFTVLIKEIVESLAMDSTDTMVSKNFSNFLMELATIAPKLMIPHLSVLCDELLNCESHVLRNCILQIMSDAIVGELTSEDLSEEMKEARNEFLEHLLLHINDVSAHVRAKVLQIWHHLKEEEAVPLSFQVKVLSAAVERLEDKTSSVRKQAVQLIKAFLERNPFAPDLTLAELKKKYSAEVAKFEKLSQLLAEERKKAEEVEEKWSSIMPELMPFVEEIVRQEQEPADTQESYEDLVQRISGMLVEKKYKEAVALVRKADHVAGNSELRLSLTCSEQCAYYMALLKSYTFLANGCKDSNEELVTQIKTVQFLQDSIEFSKVISQAMPKLLEMLSSKTNSDVFEAADLFTTGYMFGIKGTESGMRQMLYLMWSSDKEKRDAVSDAYKKVLFTTDQTGRAHAVRVVQNLSRFLENCELGHYMATECLVKEWISNEDIDNNIIQVLFERFTMKLADTTENESRLALKLLIMCSAAKSSIAAANLSIIESVGLGERGKQNPLIYSSCLEFILNSIDQSLTSKYYKRYEPDSAIVQTVTDLFLQFFMNPRVPEFDDITRSTIQFFYRMCQTPDIIAENLIKELLKRFKGAMKVDEELSASQQVQALETPFSQPTPDTQAPATAAVTQEPQFMKMPVVLLIRFIFMVGFVVLKEMIFLDIDVYNNMKYRQELSECEQKKKKKSLNQIRRKTFNLNMSATESLKRLSGAAAEPQQEPDEDLVGATAEDNVAELINHICEDVLLHNEVALLAKIFPYIFEICKYPAKYRNENLQQAATTALIRFMCVSSRTCHTNMPFLINIFNSTKNITIKCNIVIGLCDLTFRFPNVIEPWTGHFYSTLHETNNEVRLTAVKMLSHLILHEMIRVKGQIADLALCIVDAHEEVRNRTKHFFKEIAHKSNILYNVLPDIISKLSDTSLELEEEKYHVIMRHILGLIHKDRQVETLVEKLCLRFPVTREERQWRDIAYCLSLLSYNENTIKKLIDNIQHYKDKLQIDEVYQSFKLIISNTSKLAKPHLKATITELETRIEECLKVTDTRNGSDMNDENDNNNRLIPQRNKNKTVVSRRKGRSKNRKRYDQESSESSSFEEELPKHKSGKTARRGKKVVTPSTESSESDSQEAAPKNQGKTVQNSTRSKIIEESGSTEDDPNMPQRKKGRK